MWHRVKAAGAYVPVHTIQSLFDSIPKRISAVITARASSYVPPQKPIRSSQRCKKSAVVQSVRHLRHFPCFV
ncbi:hypothetical protein TNCV_5096201 [Trichonephila clavipes]|nr:hypothetical protein TNCV_5096201 [Trichonephila clavipes]